MKRIKKTNKLLNDFTHSYDCLIDEIQELKKGFKLANALIQCLLNESHNTKIKEALEAFEACQIHKKENEK